MVILRGATGNPKLHGPFLSLPDLHLFFVGAVSGRALGGSGRADRSATGGNRGPSGGHPSVEETGIRPGQPLSRGRSK